ncbi:MAG: esterase [Candidatus Eisenbacteria bacterium]|nr:esterase [Candidatus Eisenbacteria bacterium]MCC7141138.1 esterase [Candidatus Eisenbacteria bacterium]
MNLRRGRIETHFLKSTALEGNPLDDPTEREIVVCLPPGYDESRDRRYPVVICLTGYTGSGYMLLNRSAWTPSLPERHDALVAAGEIAPMILVAPDAFTRLGGSQYLDSAATGRYETHLISEVLPFVARQFRCLPAPAGWGVMGKSSGGYGALVQGMRHPEWFGALASHSGDSYFEYCYLPDFPKTIRAVESRGGLHEFLSTFEAMPRKTNDAMTALNVIAMASCYSAKDPYPGPLDPDLGIDFPFDWKTGQLRAEAWERWLALDPVRMVDRHREALAGMKLVFLDCGLRDEFNLQFGARILRDAMVAAGVRPVHEEFDDGHMNISYRFERSLHHLARALVA